MKTLFLILICIALVGCTDANDRSDQSHPTPSPSVTGPAAAVATRGYNGVGTVKALNPKGPSIEIDHGDIEGLMPAMQMEFQVSDATLLNGLQVNDQIDFTIEDRTGVMRVTAIKKK